MGMIIKHIFRNMLEKKFRTCIIILAITLSTTVLFLSISINDILNNTYTNMVRGVYGEGNVFITKSTETENPLYEETDIAIDDAQIQNRLDMINGIGVTNINNIDKKVSFIGLDIETAIDMKVIHPLHLEETTSAENDIIISAKAAEAYDLKVDDDIHVDVQGEELTFTVHGIAEPKGLFLSEVDDILLITTKEKVNELNGTNNLVMSSLFELSSSSLDEQVRELSDKNEQFTVEKTSSKNLAMRDEASFQTTMLLAIIIIVMISAYVISSISKVIMMDRIPMIGTFRSIGATKKVIHRILRLEFVFYGLFGAVFGIVVGILLLPLIANHFNEYKQIGIETVVQYNITFMLIAFLFGILFPIFISMFHIYKANKQPLKTIMLDTAQTTKEHSITSSIIGVILLLLSITLHIMNRFDQLVFALLAVLFMFVAIVMLMPILLNILSKLFTVLFQNRIKGEVNLGIKNISQNKIASNNASMIVVVLLLLLMVGITSAGIERLVNDTIKQDFDITIAEENLDLETFAHTEEIEGVSDVLYQRAGLASLEVHNVEESVGIYGVDDIEYFDEFFSGVTFEAGVVQQFNEIPNGVIMDEYQARKYHLEKGDIVRFNPLHADYNPINEDGPLVEAEIVGVMDSVTLSSNRNVFLVSQSLFDNHFIGSFNQVNIKVAHNEDIQTVKHRIESAYLTEDVQVITFEEMLSSQKATIDSLIQGIFIIIVLGLVIGLLGITNNLLISFTERKQEFAVLYSICMSKTQLMKTVIYEMVMTFIAVTIISLTAGITMYIVWKRLLYAVGLKIDFAFNIELFVILCGAVFLLLLIATIFTVRKVMKMNVLEQLRYE